MANLKKTLAQTPESNFFLFILYRHEICSPVSNRCLAMVRQGLSVLARGTLSETIEEDNASNRPHTLALRHHLRGDVHSNFQGRLRGDGSRKRISHLGHPLNPSRIHLHPEQRKDSQDPSTLIQHSREIYPPESLVLVQSRTMML